MRNEMVRVYRRSSPRTGKDFDMRLVPNKQLKQHLRAGWSLRAKKPEKKEPAPIPTEKLSFSQISEEDKLKIKNDSRSMLTLAEIYNTSYHAIRKIKGRT